ncbi:MAG: hypothetical protein AB1757_30895 [Acidobacteriota bacterium]
MKRELRVPNWMVMRFLSGGKLVSSSSNDTNSGTWRLLNARPPTCELRWERMVDRLTLSPDEQRLEGRNLFGHRM